MFKSVQILNLSTEVYPQFELLFKHSIGYEFILTILKQILDKPNEKVKSIQIDVSWLWKSNKKSYYWTVTTWIDLIDSPQFLIIEGLYDS